MLAALVFGGLLGCRSGVASNDECDTVARHLADLQVAKEQRPPLGRLATAPFNRPENVAAVYEEARANANARCLKGWKRAVFDCMMAAQDIALVDRCRFE